MKIRTLAVLALALVARFVHLARLAVDGDLAIGEVDGGRSSASELSEEDFFRERRLERVLHQSMHGAGAERFAVPVFRKPPDSGIGHFQRDVLLGEHPIQLIEELPGHALRDLGIERSEEDGAI